MEMKVPWKPALIWFVLSLGFLEKAVALKMSSPPKPWKQKHKRTQSSTNIEIYEGKPTVPTGPHLETTPADDKNYMRMICKGDVEFLVPLKVIDQLKCVDVILHGQVEFKEKVEKVIRFPEFRPEVLESVMRFVFIEYLDSIKAEKYWGENAPRVAFQFEVDAAHVMELVYAAHFFGAVNLLKVAAAMIAHHFNDVPDVSSMPADLAWCVAQQFSPQDLFSAEERPDFKSLSLQTSSLWEEHCRKLLQNEAAEIVSSDNYPQYDMWLLLESPPSTSWKSLFMSHYLQQLADRQDGSTNESFIQEVSRKGEWGHAHTIRWAVWEWVFTGEKSLSFESYAAQFPNLFSLCLHKVPLGDNLVVARLLKLMPRLRLLDISETGLTKHVAVALSESLESHTSLQVLRAAYNLITTDGYAAILRALPTTKSVKLLDVRENGIGAIIPEDAVVSLHESGVEELLFDGNCKVPSLGHNLVPVLTEVPSALKSIHLKQCGLSDRNVQLLADALTGASTIKRLDLSDNHITSAGVSSLLAWLQSNTSLVELSLANNYVTDSCSEMICITLGIHPSLEKLTLMGNYSYGEDNLDELIHTAVERGNLLLSTVQKKFTLDLRSTDVSYARRARIQRQAVNFTSLSLLI